MGSDQGETLGQRIGLSYCDEYDIRRWEDQSLEYSVRDYITLSLTETCRIIEIADFIWQHAR